MNEFAVVSFVPSCACVCHSKFILFYVHSRIHSPNRYEVRPPSSSPTPVVYAGAPANNDTSATYEVVLGFNVEDGANTAEEKPGEVYDRSQCRFVLVTSYSFEP